MKAVTLIVFFFANSLAQDVALESGWKGLKVFQSSRADVEQILGVPGEQITGVEVSYRTQEGLHHFVFSDRPCSDRGDGRFTVPQNTILEYQIFLKEGIEVAKLKWDRKLYERTESSHIRGLIHYSNQKDAIRLMAELKDGVEKVFILHFNRRPECSKKLLCVGTE